jgi:hypothetical protein
MIICNVNNSQTDSVQYSNRERNSLDLSPTSENSYLTRGRIIKFIDKGPVNSIGPGSYETDPFLIRKKTNSISWRPTVLQRNLTIRKTDFVGPGSYDVGYGNRMILKRSSNPIFPRAPRYSKSKIEGNNSIG